MIIILHHYPNSIFHPRPRFLLNSQASYIRAWQTYPIQSIQDALFSHFFIHMHLSAQKLPAYLNR